MKIDLNKYSEFVQAVTSEPSNDLTTFMNRLDYLDGNFDYEKDLLLRLMQNLIVCPRSLIISTTNLSYKEPTTQYDTLFQKFVENMKSDLPSTNQPPEISGNDTQQQDLVQVIKHNCKRYQCKSCQEFFKSERGLKYHVTQQHLQHLLIKGLTCTTCSATFKSTSNLMKHIRKMKCSSTQKSAATVQNCVQLSTDSQGQNSKQEHATKAEEVNIYRTEDQLEPLTSTKVQKIFDFVFHTEQVLDANQVAERLALQLKPFMMSTDISRYNSVWKNGDLHNRKIKDHKLRDFFKLFGQLLSQNQQFQAYALRVGNIPGSPIEKFLQQLTQQDQPMLEKIGRQMIKYLPMRHSIVMCEKFSKLLDYLTDFVKTQCYELLKSSSKHVVHMIRSMLHSYDSNFFIVKQEDAVKINIKSDPGNQEDLYINDFMHLLRRVFDHMFKKTLDIKTVFQCIHQLDLEQIVNKRNDPSGKVLQLVFDNLDRWKKWYSEDEEDVKYHQQFKQILWTA